MVHNLTATELTLMNDAFMKIKTSEYGRIRECFLAPIYKCAFKRIIKTVLINSSNEGHITSIATLYAKRIVIV